MSKTARAKKEKAPKVISEDQKTKAEEQISAHHKTIDYDTREYPVEVLVRKYLERLEDDDNELFIPDYQREHVWSQEHQSKFIESVLIGLPIPYLFVADVRGKEGRLEIIDGSQRIRTLSRFFKNELQLIELEKLTEVNGFKFEDLPLSRQRRFSRHTIRMIELSEKADENVRRDIFERINTGSNSLTNMEVRWGTNDNSPFLKFLKELSEDSRFQSLAPLSDGAVRRRERQEFVLRFFAYLNNYENFQHSVVHFLNKYIKAIQTRFDDSLAASMKNEWEEMLLFVERNFPNGFQKAEGHIRTPRIRFEAMAVGSALALRQVQNLKVKPEAITELLESKEFKKLTTSDASNSRVKVIKRIEYVRDQLLGSIE
jgi:hypothetical protein